MPQSVKKEKAVKVKVPKPKLPPKSKLSLDEFFETVPTQEWKPKDWIYFVAFVRKTYLGIPYIRPAINGRHCRIMKTFVERYGPDRARKIVEGIYLFKSELAVDEYKRTILSTLNFALFGAACFGPTLEKALLLMENSERIQDLPDWKKKPSGQWNSEDWKQYREATKGGK